MKLIPMRCLLLGLCALFLGSTPQVLGETPACGPQFTKDQERILSDYVRKRYRLPDNIALSLKKETAVNGCFRELVFEGKSVLKTWELTLYASPDARFLSSDLFDTTVDPVHEQRSKDEAFLKGLVQGAIASRGPANAPVTIVEFSDFECPFCRKFANVLNEALAKNEDDVRVVFHHLPLTMHPWARMAAEAAGCAQLQSNEAFWSMHDRIFGDQAAITKQNAKEKLAEIAKNSKSVDAAAVDNCLANGMSVGLVLKDLNVAESYQINATPTVFINGHRIQGVENAAKLREMIAEARKEASEGNSAGVGISPRP
jgi:predicted DsbA family dithiol-disulfide isomerase